MRPPRHYLSRKAPRTDEIRRFGLFAVISRINAFREESSQWDRAGKECKPLDWSVSAGENASPFPPASSRDTIGWSRAPGTFPTSAFIVHKATGALPRLPLAGGNAGWTEAAHSLLWVRLWAAGRRAGWTQQGCSVSSNEDTVGDSSQMCCLRAGCDQTEASESSAQWPRCRWRSQSLAGLLRQRAEEATKESKNAGCINAEMINMSPKASRSVNSRCPLPRAWNPSRSRQLILFCARKPVVLYSFHPQRHTWIRGHFVQKLVVWMSCQRGRERTENVGYCMSSQHFGRPSQLTRPRGFS